MRLLDPIAITGADFDVALIPDGIQAPRPPARVRVANESPYALRISGLGGDAHWLQPWSVDVYEAWGASTFHVHPIQLVSPLPPAPFSSLLVTVADAVDTIPGVYPASLDRQSAAYNQAQLLGVLTTASGLGASKSQSFTLRPGTVAVGFVIDYHGGNPDPIAIVGDDTLNTYLNIHPAGGAAGIIWAEMVNPVMDSSVTCSVTNSGSASCTVRFLFWLSQAVVQVKAPIGQPLAVSQNGSSPAPWQAPTRSLVFDVSLNNSSSTLVAGVSGQSIYVHSWMCTFSAVAAATVILEQDDSVIQFAIWNNVATVGPFSGDSKGAFTAGGKGLRIRNPFAVATIARGHVTYSQAA